MKKLVMNTENFVTIRTYHDQIMGELVLAALNQAGIETFPVKDLQNPIPTENHIAIHIHESDVEAALEIIEDQENA
jgi:hypothetical protein